MKRTTTIISRTQVVGMVSSTTTKMTVVEEDVEPGESCLKREPHVCDRFHNPRPGDRQTIERGQQKTWRRGPPPRQPDLSLHEPIISQISGICTREGMCSVDHTTCNGFPRNDP